MDLNINTNRVIIASDHAGYNMKTLITQKLQNEINFIDLGTYSDNKSVDYPKYAHILVEKVLECKLFGILICFTGIGMSIAANRYSNIRAALCNDIEATKLAREHNDANILVLSSRLAVAFAVEIVKTFLNTVFSYEERHIRRINKL